MFLLPARTITGPDVDASKVPPVACQPGCTTLTIGALCDTKGAQITLMITWIDSSGNYLGTIGPIVLIAETVASWGAQFRALNVDGGEPTYHVGGYAALVQVVALAPNVIAGKPVWSLTAGAQ